MKKITLAVLSLLFVLVTSAQPANHCPKPCCSKTACCAHACTMGGACCDHK
jgi:hypothetical protein